MGMSVYAKHHVPRSCAPNATEDVIAKGIELTAKMRQAGYLRQFRSLKHANIFEWTSKPKVPSMVVSGEFDETADKKMVKKIANEIMDFGEYNESIMDFGGSVCLAKKPLCPRCIFKKECYAKKKNKEF